MAKKAPKPGKSYVKTPGGKKTLKPGEGPRNAGMLPGNPNPGPSK